jgi:hypothetical protein
MMEKIKVQYDAERNIGPGIRGRFLSQFVKNFKNQIFSNARVTAQGEGGPGRRRDLAVQAVTDKLYVSPALETVSWANESGYPAYLYVHRTRVGKKSRIFLHGIPDRI